MEKGERPLRLCSFRILSALALLLAGAKGVVRAETLTLEDCLRETLAHNPEIARARVDVERAQGTRLSLRSRALPQLGIGFTAGYQGAQTSQELRVYRAANNPDAPLRDPVTGIVLVGTQLTFDGNGNITNPPVFNAKGERIFDTLVGERAARVFTLGTGNSAQPLFDFGIPATYRRSNLEVASARYNFAAAAVTALHAVRLEFNSAIYARESEEIARRVLGRLGENEKTQREAVAAGLSARTSLLQARIQQINLTPQRLAAASSGRTALIALLGFMGRDLGPHGSDPTVSAHLAGTLDAEGEDREFGFDLTQSAELALRRRPDLAQLRATVASLAEDSRIQRAGDYPIVRFVVNGSLIPQTDVRTSQQSIRESDNVRTSEIRYGGDFTWNVLDLGAVRGPVAAFRASSEVVAARLRGAEEAVPRDLARVRSALQSAARRRRALRGAQAAAAGTLNAVQAASVQGTATQYEVLQAQTDLLANRLELLTAAYDEANARAEFDRVTGGYLRYVDAAADAGSKNLPAHARRP